MSLLWLTFGFGAVSAVVPVFNMEAYISVVHATTRQHPALLLAALGSLGQSLGKLVWYYLARGAVDVPWLRRRLESPRRQAGFRRWQARVQGRPAAAGALVGLSAATGFPPFFAMAMVAGSLRMNVVVFFLAGLVGRTFYFWVWLTGVGLVVG